MILSNEYSVKLPKKYKTILFLHAASKETFVFLAMLTPRRDGMAHVDSQGKILFECAFDFPMLAMGMLSDREAIFIETRKNRISVLNLDTHEFRYYPHLFVSEESDQSDIFTFADSRYLCIEEKGRYNINRYKLTYYQYPLQLNEKKAPRTLQVYESKENDWTYEYQSRKANGRSMVMWYKPKHDDDFEFKTYEYLPEKGKGEFKHYKFPFSLASRGTTTKVETLCHNAWELRSNCFIFLCWVGKETNRQGALNSNYVVDIDNQGAITEAAFTFGPYQDLLIDCLNLGEYSMLRTFSFDSGKAVKTPTYYIHNASERIVAEEIWQCSNLYKYELEGYSSGLLCEGLYNNQDVDEFKTRLKKVVDPKVVYGSLLREGP
jgi:hypothetical protein